MPFAAKLMHLEELLLSEVSPDRERQLSNDINVYVESHKKIWMNLSIKER